MPRHKIIISGGGTGGHVFPAIAIANALKKKQQDMDILFVGAKGRMEMEKVPAAGYNIEGLWISGLQRRFTLKNLSFPFKVMSSLMKAKKILKQFKPDAAVGVGGYASGPMLHVAAKSKVPTLIQEQNSYPGITNRMLAGKVRKICVAYDGMEQFFPQKKIILTGNPVRQDIANIKEKKQDALEHFGLSADKKVLFVTGGSLGAKTINESITLCLEKLLENDIQLIWQTGKAYYEKAQETMSALPHGKISGGAFEFIARMDYAYAAADLVVSRAGAISVSELCLAKKAAILIPSPNVAEDHQAKNAMALVNHHAALLIRDNEAREKLGEAVLELLANDEKMGKLSRNISALARPDAADDIASEILNMIEN